MEIFVLNYLSDPSDEMSSAYVCGVFNDQSKADAALKEEFASALTDVMDAYDVESRERLEEEPDVNIAESENECSIYYAGNYREYKITKWEV